MALEFEVMYEDDIYNADTVCNVNFARIAENVLPMVALSKAAYDALADKEADRVYLVVNNGKVYPYLGELPFAGGVAPAYGEQTLNLQGITMSNTGAAGGLNSLNMMMSMPPEEEPTNEDDER